MPHPCNPKVQEPGSWITSLDGKSEILSFFFEREKRNPMKNSQMCPYQLVPQAPPVLCHPRVLGISAFALGTVEFCQSFVPLTSLSCLGWFCFHLRLGLCSPGWPGTHYVAQFDLLELIRSSWLRLQRTGLTGVGHHA